MNKRQRKKKADRLKRSKEFWQSIWAHHREIDDKAREIEAEILALIRKENIVGTH